MKMVLPITFTPVSEEWSAYCEFALKMLWEYKDTAQPEIAWDATQESFFISGIPYTDSPAYFKARETFSDTKNILLVWLRLVGSTGVFQPFADVARKNGEVKAYFLRVNVEGSDKQMGVYRLCNSLLFGADKLSSPELELIKSIVDRLEK